MKGLKRGALILMGILAWAHRPGLAQDQESGMEGVIIDSDGAMFDPATGRRLTPEEVAAELERRARASEEPAVSEEEPVSTEPLSAAEAVAPPTGTAGITPEVEVGGSPAVTSPPAERAASPAPRSAPAPQRPAPRPEGREATEEEETPFNFASPDQGSPARFPPEETVTEPPSPPAQPSPAFAALLPPNSPAARLLQDHRYALEEARLIAGPDGNWLTLQEAQKQRYREGDLRALLQAYREARQALQRGDQGQLQQALRAFMERLDRINQAAGRSTPASGSRDLEALRKQLEAGVLAAYTPPPPSPLEVDEGGPKRFPWSLVAGLVVLGLLGGGLAWRRFRRPAQGPALPVKGQVMVVRGPDAGKVWEVEGEQVLFGTGEECAVRLTDPSLSPRHAALTHEPDGFHVANLDPDFETWVNGRPITAALLQEGDVIEIGQTALSFEPASG
jgi:hypothetical protein